MIYILTAIFIGYVMFQEWRIRRSFDIVTKYINDGVKGRAEITDRFNILNAGYEHLTQVVSVLRETRAKARRHSSQSPIKVKLPKNFGIVKANKADAVRIRRRDAMRCYRAKVKAARGK